MKVILNSYINKAVLLQVIISFKISTLVNKAYGID